MEVSNCKIALEKALEAAEAEGAEIQLIDSNKLNISACQGDNYCKAHEGKCAIDDDMTQIYQAIEDVENKNTDVIHTVVFKGLRLVR